MSRKTASSSSADRVLLVLSVLERNFAQGFTPGDIAQSTGLDAAAVTRALAALEKRGYAEPVGDTGRTRISHRFAQVAVSILHSLDVAEQRIAESRSKIQRPL